MPDELSPEQQREIDGREWAKHNFSKVDLCQLIGCDKPATWSAIPNTVTDPYMHDTMTCDAHLVEIGLTTHAGYPLAEYWTVRSIEPKR